MEHLNNTFSTAPDHMESLVSLSTEEFLPKSFTKILGQSSVWPLEIITQLQHPHLVGLISIPAPDWGSKSLDPNISQKMAISPMESLPDLKI
ncbi:hypothetical protein O181_083543 [Austropuccinia psidii MF-1]|uniref:Uncharacterized protein n=1 Tax=Austropuccinia psidii MF-1 TaxID=1389203 RepID=A0A9Q3FPK4_9BASI|nr:hypothetical protein [Austropuccinia psidii MF-1]